MKSRSAKKPVRCAIYTRVSTDHGLEQDFNSLDAQYDASQAYIRSQAHAGWTPLRAKYDDGGFSGGNTDRPALQRLLADVRARKVDVIVVYKVDRLTRSLADFAKLVELFDAHNVSFVSVTQQFNTTTSMGRLTLNVLLSFAQFEREVTSERIRDKIAASKRKGLWVGGMVPLGYDTKDRKITVNEGEAAILSPDPLRGDLALELGKRQQHVESEPSHRGGGVELWVTETNDTLCASNNSTSLAKSAKRPGQAVHLVDHDDVDLAGPHVRKKPLQGRAVGVATREAAVVVFGPERRPAGMGLAPNVGLGGVILCVERIEVLLQAVVRRDPGIDGATHRFFGRSGLHEADDSAWVVAQAEKPWPAPAGAGDRQGDLREARIGVAVPGEAFVKNRQAMHLPIPFAAQNGAGAKSMLCRLGANSTLTSLLGRLE